jgi:hypothetical protein
MSTPAAHRSGILRERRENHVAAVRTAVGDDAIAVYRRAISEPLDTRRDVRDGVHPFFGVVEIHVLAAVSGRATHVRLEDGVALREEILMENAEGGTGLAFRAAVNIDDNRERTAITVAVGSGGNGEESRHLQPVEGVETNEFGGTKRLLRDAGRRGIRPPLGFADIALRDVHVCVFRRSRDGSGDRLAVGTEGKPRQDAVGKVGFG